MTLDHILPKFSSQADLAAYLRLKRQAVAAWKARGGVVPPRHWNRLKDTAAIERWRERGGA